MIEANTRPLPRGGRADTTAALLAVGGGLLAAVTLGAVIGSNGLLTPLVSPRAEAHAAAPAAATYANAARQTPSINADTRTAARTTRLTPVLHDAQPRDAVAALPARPTIDPADVALDSADPFAPTDTAEVSAPAPTIDFPDDFERPTAEPAPVEPPAAGEPADDDAGGGFFGLDFE